MLLAAAPAALLSSCTSQGPSTVSGAQARNSLCVHLTLLAATAIEIPTTIVDQVVPALDVDARLLQEAGDRDLAAKVRALGSKIQAARRPSDDADVAVFLDTDVTDEARAALERLIRTLA